MRITAAAAVEFVPYNINKFVYQPGEFYEVPQHVASSMVLRGVAEIATPEQAPQAPQLPTLAPTGADEGDAKRRKTLKQGGVS